MDNIPAANGRRFAGALTFGPDDKLYVTTSNTSQIEKGQKGNLSGKVLRINRDGTIPQDSPKFGHIHAGTRQHIRYRL